jgi:RNA polymerase sigma-70 factor (ECF subfamily)
VSGVPEAADEELIARFVNGADEAAFRLLYRRHAPFAFGMLCRLNGGREGDAADMLQEAWVRAAAALRGFRGEARFRTWLCGIALNCHREWHRARAKSREADVEEAGEPAAVADARRVDIDQVLRALPQLFLEVLVLHDVEGYTHEEIAGALAIEPGTSKTRLLRARRLFRARWSGGHTGGGR